VKTSQLPVWFALGAAFTLGIAWARAQALAPGEELGKALFFDKIEAIKRKRIFVIEGFHLVAFFKERSTKIVSNVP
jgi:hypothetical protein